MALAIRMDVNLSQEVSKLSLQNISFAQFVEIWTLTLGNQSQDQEDQDLEDRSRVDYFFS